MRLREEPARPGYRCEPIALGVNTDAYPPLERELGITRELLQVMLDCGHPVSLITKSALIERDVDLLSELAARRLLAARFAKVMRRCAFPGMPGLARSHFRAPRGDGQLDLFD